MVSQSTVRVNGRTDEPKLPSLPRFFARAGRHACTCMSRSCWVAIQPFADRLLALQTRPPRNAKEKLVGLGTGHHSDLARPGRQ